ncbi:hypothetical protein OH77DRAFT_1440281 [Trametes cingulata]|nr:hypothetical protein OH77DRAFT_1440281 [Trametes cingulata]
MDRDACNHVHSIESLLRRKRPHSKSPHGGGRSCDDSGVTGAVGGVSSMSDVVPSKRARVAEPLGTSFAATTEASSLTPLDAAIGDASGAQIEQQHASGACLYPDIGHLARTNIHIPMAGLVSARIGTYSREPSATVSSHPTRSYKKPGSDPQSARAGGGPLSELADDGDSVCHTVSSQPGVRVDSQPLAAPMKDDFALIFLPAPIGGFPVVYQAFPDALTCNVDPRQLRDWSSHPESTSTAVQVYGAGYPAHDEAKVMVDRIRGAVVALTGCSAAEVAAPIGVRGPDGELAHPPPTIYFVYRLDESATARLKKQVCWSTKTIAFFSYSLRPSIPEFLFALHGFSHPDVEEFEALVKQTMAQPKYRDFTLSFAADNPEFSGLSHDSIMDTLIRSIQVKVVEVTQNGPLVVNIYGKSPTRSPDLWCTWRDVLRDAEYYSSYARVGLTNWRCQCSGCHSADHTRMHCPFDQNVPGWRCSRATR